MSEEAIQTESGAQGDTGNAGGEAGQEASWLDALPEDLKGNEALKTFEGPEALAKAYLDASGKVPNVPETPEAYEIPIQAKDEISKVLADKFRVWSHENKLTVDQAKTLAGQYQAYATEVEQSIMRQVEQAEQAGVDELRKEWGKDFEANVMTAKQAAMRFGGEDFAQYLEQTRLGNHPAMLRTLLAVGKAISEDALIEGGSASSHSMEYTQAGNPLLKYDKTPSMKR